MSQVTIISGLERRRTWSDDEKLALVEASMEPGANVADLARRADCRPSQIYRWRRELLDPTPSAPTGFAPVIVEKEVPPALPSSSAPVAPVGTEPSCAAIIIKLDGAVVRVAADAPPALLAAAIKACKR
ncbi:hypothetical protein BSL82_10390 [Tardibacter chloracetimidivorans]|uniref:Transposase n=1 Tax=Tardibacter chloracetimidivorans TaxID=1921510 RepID=A0A1L3ZVJ0_9SPHN|nr:transposase [Tardibacter chloracetimidivorans]API59676.1 hypothetical protein BSL82_10390 [Tardibacter chloracetimidivorans]